jgi:ATP-binding cassette subfamily F protein uup
MPPPLLTLQGITLTFGGTPLLAGADLAVNAGERLALVGRNGSGKSTLLRIAAGLAGHDGGQRFAQPSAVIRYLPQEPDLSGFATTLDYAQSGLAPGHDPWRARYLLEQLGLTGHEPTANLSGGEAKRAALACVLAPEPDILLLDEPTNHLDLPAIEWLESEIGSMRSAVVLISHDRRFLENLSRATLWLDRGRTRLLDKSFAAFEAWRDEVLAQEELDRHKLDRKIEREEHWVRYGVSARRTRNERRMRELAGLKAQRREARRVVGQVNLAASEAEASGMRVIEAKNLTKAYDGRVIVREFSTRILRGDRVGIVGANGAGKTTLIDLLTGVTEPDSGTLKLGTNLALARLDQKRTALDPETSVADTLTDGRGSTVTVAGATKHVTSYMKDFLFLPEQARTPVKVLSGGERARLLLARALATPANLMVLDEPTNDLDLETLDLLQELLADYPGTVLVVSHDRDFLDRVATSVIFAEGEGKFTEYAGGYTDMLAQRGQGVSARAVVKSAPVKTPERAAAAPEQAPRKKLSFKDKHALDTLPGIMAGLETKIATLQTALAAPDLYVKDRKRFDTLSGELSAAQAELATAEDRWLELEMLRDAIEG